MKWYVKKEKKVWNIYLHKEFCLTENPVLYCTSLTKEAALVALSRLNNPTFVQLAEFKELDSKTKIKSNVIKKSKKTSKKTK